MEKLRKSFQEILEAVDDLHCILITDRDGITVLKAVSSRCPEHITKPNFYSSVAIDQGGKLGLGKTEAVVCYYSEYQVVQMNKLPVFVTFIGGDKCNTGHILALEEIVDGLLTNVVLAVNEA